jgi:hypothetical protein
MCNCPFRTWGKQPLVAAPPPRSHKAFTSASGGACRRAQGLRDHACMTGPILELADLAISQYNSALSGEWTRGLLIRRQLADGALACSPPGVPRVRP